MFICFPQVACRTGCRKCLKTSIWPYTTSCWEPKTAWNPFVAAQQLLRDTVKDAKSNFTTMTCTHMCVCICDLCVCVCVVVYIYLLYHYALWCCAVYTIICYIYIYITVYCVLWYIIYIYIYYICRALLTKNASLYKHGLGNRFNSRVGQNIPKRKQRLLRSEAFFRPSPSFGQELLQ